MPSINYKIEITGVSPLWKPTVYLEEEEIKMERKKSGKQWINEKVLVPVSGKLHIFMRIRGDQGIKFDVLVKNLDRDVARIEESDRTIGDTGGINNSIINKDVTA